MCTELIIFRLHWNAWVLIELSEFNLSALKANQCCTTKIHFTEPLVIIWNACFLYAIDMIEQWYKIHKTFWSVLITFKKADALFDGRLLN